MGSIQGPLSPISGVGGRRDTFLPGAPTDSKFHAAFGSESVGDDGRAPGTTTILVGRSWNPPIILYSLASATGLWQHTPRQGGPPWAKMWAYDLSVVVRRFVEGPLNHCSDHSLNEILQTPGPKYLNNTSPVIGR